MPLLPILRYPDARLRVKTRPVAQVTEDLRRLVADMTETMYASRGAGLAAVQVGVDHELFLIEATIAGGSEDDPPLVFINPALVSAEGSQVGEEGCLSFPGVFVPVKRAMKCTVRARDLEGREFTATGEALYARALQHELDHCKGRLLIDMVGPVKRRFIKRQMEKLAREGDEAIEAQAAVGGPRL
jgi:peptide deformylase